MPKCRIVKEDRPGIVKMKDMQPLQIGRVDDSGSRHHGHLVLRTQSKEQFEVVDLTDFRGDHGWTTCSLGDKVRLLAPGKEVTLVLSND